MKISKQHERNINRTGGLAAYILVWVVCCSSIPSYRDVRNHERQHVTHSYAVKSFRDSLTPTISISGIYRNVSIAYDSVQKSISGVYEYYDRWNEKYKEYMDINVFYFFGLMKQPNSADIKASWPTDDQKLTGHIVISRGKTPDTLVIFLNAQPNGYADVNFTARQGVSLEFVKRTSWLQIRIIKLNKAHFFNTSDSSNMRKGFLLKGDIVKVLSKNDHGWYQVEYSAPKANKKPTFGWMPESCLYDIDPDKWGN